MFARQLMRSNQDLVCLKASQPVMMSQCMGSDGAVLPPANDVTMYQNEYSADRLTPEMKQKLKGIVDSSSNLSFIDFTNPEDLFDFSAGNKDSVSARHPVVRLAKAIPTGFMKQFFDQYQIPPKSSPQPSMVPPDENTANGSNASASAAVLSSITGADGGYSHYTCHECKQQFSALHLFQRHFLTHPDPEHKKFLCQVCGKRFSRADHLNRHAQLHTDVTVHKCILCGEEFARASHLDKHRRRTHAPNAPANMTSKSITSSNNLHLLAAVASPDSFQPQLIGQSHHVGPSTSTSVTIQASDQIVGESGALQIAIVNPEGASEIECQTEPDRPFPCSVCGRKFIRATHLRRHMRIHTGEKPFFCHICGRRYARGDYLRAHIHAHRREKFHKCRVCGEVYHDLARFSNHCLSHNESEFLEASLRENKRRAENKLTQKLSSSKRADVPQTAGPAAPIVAMPAQVEHASLMSQDPIGEICVSPIENPMHFVEDHECTISSAVNEIQYQIVSAEQPIIQAQPNASDVNDHHPQQQPHTIVNEVNIVSDTANNTIQLQMTPSSFPEQAVISFPTQVSQQVPQNHQMVTLPTPQITPTQSPEFGQITLSHFQDSSSSHPPPLQRAVVSQDTDILQHYSLIKSFNNEVMLIAPPASLTSNSNYNNHVSSATAIIEGSAGPYFPTPSASPMVYQGMSMSELGSDVP